MGPVTDASLVAALDSDAGVVSGYVFGSYADGRAHRESDVDVAVLLDHRSYPTAAARFEARLRLSGDLVRALGRSDIDLVVLNDAPPTLVRAIVTRGRRVVCRDDEADHAYRRTILSRAADLEPFLRRMRAIKLDALRR
jgi:uncharacterized protein